MKLAFVVYNDFIDARVLELLGACGIDYYTRWERTTGRGRGTEPHLGTGSYASTNSVLMIAFEDDAPLERLVAQVAAVNAETRRPDNRIRLFQLPLERIV
jgi:hypothetical protein